jgi:hypothetical protein
MPFNSAGFKNPAKANFNGKSFGDFENAKQFQKSPTYSLESNPFKFTPDKDEIRSRIKYYDQDSLWARWRRGYELYTITQSVLGTTAVERESKGDYRLYCSYQQYPGVFIPVRLFTFPSTNEEAGQQIVGMRDANSFNFYKLGLPILAVRYLGQDVIASYDQVGATLTVTKVDHGLLIGENVYFEFQSGNATNTTLPIVSKTQNTFTVSTPFAVGTSGDVKYYLSTTFDDNRWVYTRAQLRYLPEPVDSFEGERFVDRVVERDPGILSTYSRTSTTVTVNCASEHGLSSGNKVFVAVTSGAVASGQYVITVTSPTQLTFSTIVSNSTTGNLTLTRLIPGYRYDDFVGYTAIGTDVTTNELIFQRGDSYGTKTTNGNTETIVPAHRGFTVGRFLTTELRWQCGCQDYTRRSGYNLYKEIQTRKFPVTAITSTKPGQAENRDGTLSDTRDLPGTFSDLGYISINNFYQLPNYNDKANSSYPSLMYYQLRWCKHIYAAMFSLQHDEGNEQISITTRYTQSGSNITVYAQSHNLTANTKIQIEFTSGSAISGEYTVTTVPTADTFVVVYPFSNITEGYCVVSNLKEHEFVSNWLLEPSDKPIGDSLDTFYRNFDKENEKLRQAAERLLMVKQGVPWSGNKSITGSYNQPQQVANYDPQLLSMMLTDDIRRNQECSDECGPSSTTASCGTKSTTCNDESVGHCNQLDRNGVPLNLTNRMLPVLSKLLNVRLSSINSIKLGTLDQPLTNYVTDFEFGLIDGGNYSNDTSSIDRTTISLPIVVTEAFSRTSSSVDRFSLESTDIKVTQDNYLALNLGTLMDAYKPVNRDWAYYKLERNVSDEFENYASGDNIGTFSFNKRDGTTLATMDGATQYFRTDPTSTSRGFIGNSGNEHNTVVLWLWFDVLPTTNKFLWIASNATQTIYTGLRFNAASKCLQYIRYRQGLHNVVVTSVSQIEANRLYTTCCRYNKLTGFQELYINNELESSTTSLSTLTISAADPTRITVGLSINEGFTKVNVGHFRLARLLLTDIYQLMSVPVPKIFFGDTVVGNEWIVLFNDTILGFTVPAGITPKAYPVYVKINGISNIPIVVDYIDLPICSTALSITFDNDLVLDQYFDKMRQQWGGANGGVVAENVTIGADDESNQVLVLECHGDYYADTVQGVDRFGNPKFNPDGTPWVKRVGGVVASREYFCFGRYEYEAKVVQVLGVASAFWHFHYQEIYPDDPRWNSYTNDLGLRTSGDAENGFYIVRNNEIDIELPSHLLGGNIEDPSLSNGKFNTWRGELQNYDVAPGDPGYWEEYRDNYRPLGFNAADGQYHTYRYDWYHDRVEFYVDNVLIVTNINNQFGYDSNNLPDVASKVTIGPWFPSARFKWAGPFANFAIEKMYVKRFSYIPFPEEIANHQVFVGETYARFR